MLNPNTGVFLDMARVGLIRRLSVKREVQVRMGMELDPATGRLFLGWLRADVSLLQELRLIILARVCLRDCPTASIIDSTPFSWCRPRISENNMLREFERTFSKVEQQLRREFFFFFFALLARLPVIGQLADRPERIFVISTWTGSIKKNGGMSLTI